jgi:single-strand DNA-binding protein
MASMGVACSRRYQSDGEWREETSFFNVTAWGDMGENAAASLTKGTRVVAFGRHQQRTYETTDGEKRTVWDLVADEIGPSLRWATVEVNRTERTKPEAGAPTNNRRLDNEEPF